MKTNHIQHVHNRNITKIRLTKTKSFQFYPWKWQNLQSNINRNWTAPYLYKAIGALVQNSIFQNGVGGHFRFWPLEKIAGISPLLSSPLLSSPLLSSPLLSSPLLSSPLLSSPLLSSPLLSSPLLSSPLLSSPLLSSPLLSSPLLSSPLLSSPLLYLLFSPLFSSPLSSF